MCELKILQTLYQDDMATCKRLLYINRVIAKVDDSVELLRLLCRKIINNAYPILECEPQEDVAAAVRALNLAWAINRFLDVSPDQLDDVARHYGVFEKEEKNDN